MKKYFLLLFVFVSFAFGSQHSVFAAQPLPATHSCTPGKSICTKGLVCRQFNADQCINANNPQQVKIACAIECLPPLPQQQGQICTGSGNGNCAAGLVCLVDQSTCTNKVNGHPIPGQVCQNTCQTPPPTPFPPPKVVDGQPCINSTQCAQGSSCKKGTCEEPGNQGNQCKPDNPSAKDPTQGTCGAGLLCEGYNPTSCSTSLIDCTGTCVSASSNTNPNSPLLPPCGQWLNNKCTTFTTALGSFPTDPDGFIEKIFTILLSISGGIASLLIIRAGYQLVTSQGKPEQIQQGRDQLVAAIVGLAFLIFAFVFLQIIGYDILRLPGFGQ